MLHANILCLDRVKNCIKEVEEMFPWIVVLAVLGLVMIFAEILMPGFGLFGILGTISLFNHAGCSCGCIFCNGISGKAKWTVQ